MNKYLIGLLVTIIVCPKVYAHGGGDAALGALGGLAVGTMIGSAVASDSKKSSRAEQEAIRAQDKADRAQEKAEQLRIERAEEKTEQLRIEHEQERVRQLERQLDKQKDTDKGSTTTMLLLGLVAILLLAVIGLGVVVLRRKP